MRSTLAGSSSGRCRSFYISAAAAAPTRNRASNRSRANRRSIGPYMTTIPGGCPGGRRSPSNLFRARISKAMAQDTRN